MQNYCFLCNKFADVTSEYLLVCSSNVLLCEDCIKARSANALIHVNGEESYLAPEHRSDSEEF